MAEKRTLDRLRAEYDTWQLLDAVDALDEIRGIVGDGPNLEPPEGEKRAAKTAQGCGGGHQ